jgi:hypothetical protein
MMGNKGGPPLNKGGHATLKRGIDGIVEDSFLSSNNNVMATKTKIAGCVTLR